MTIPATERTSTKGYSTDIVVNPAQAEAIRQSLYRTDAAAVGRILPSFNQEISDTDIAHFREHGYLAMNGLLTTPEVEECKAGLSDLAHRRTVWDKRVWSQEEPYFAQGGQETPTDDPEHRLRKLAYFVHLEPRLRAAARRGQAHADRACDLGHRVAAVEHDAAFARMRVAANRHHQRRFTRSIGAQQAINPAGPAGKTDIFHRANLAAFFVVKALGQTTGFDHRQGLVEVGGHLLVLPRLSTAAQLPSRR